MSCREVHDFCDKVTPVMFPCISYNVVIVHYILQCVGVCE